MNKFELFCMIFFVLDAEWDESQDQSLANYLSGANPFLFADVGSADPSVYLSYCNEISEPIPIEDSFKIARSYVRNLGIQSAEDAFNTFTEEEWLDSVYDYLSEPHKGQSD